MDKLALIKLIAELQKTRLDLYSAPAIMQKAVEHVQKLQNKIAALQKEQHKGAAYDFVYEVDKAAGQEDKITRKMVKKKKVVEDASPIV